MKRDTRDPTDSVVVVPMKIAAMFACLKLSA